MTIDPLFIQMFLGLGATAIAAACGFVIALSRQVSSVAASVESLSRMQSQERTERLDAEERIHSRIDDTQRIHPRNGGVHL